MESRKVEIKEIDRGKHGKGTRNHQIIVDGEIKETLIDEYIGYVKQVAKDYEFYGMRKEKWLDKMVSEGKIRPEDRWKY